MGKTQSRNTKVKQEVKNLFSLKTRCPQIHDAFSKNGLIVFEQNDSLKACKVLPDNTFNLIISSPPYNIGKEYEKTSSLNEYLGWQEETLLELVRILHPEGSLCWQVGNYVDKGEVFPLDIYFYPILKKLGLSLRNRIIWHFGHGLHASKRFSGRYETLLWFTKGNNYTFNLDPVRVSSKYPGKRHYKGEKKGQPSGNPLGKNPSDYWTLMEEEFKTGIIEIPNVKSNHPEKTAHPCQFPIELVERCVLAFTNEDDWVLDPYAGAGSSVIAAVKRNRRAMGIERDGTYCALAKERIKAFYEGVLEIRPIGKPIFQPTGKETVSQIPIEWLNARDK